MKTSDFDYYLPPQLIAQTPVEPRDHSRLLVLHRRSGAIEHRRFFEIDDFLRGEDVLVFNDSRVIPARLRGRKTSGAKIELLLLHRQEPNLWETLVRPARRVRPGDRIEIVTDTDYGKTSSPLSPFSFQAERGEWFPEGIPAHQVFDFVENPQFCPFGLPLVESLDRKGEDLPPSSYSSGLIGEVVEQKEGAIRIIRFSDESLLEKLGEVPLPPYIHTPLSDPERYQTVYARIKGSVAAPTAGLHFTPGLFSKLQEKGVEFVFVTLHIGLDTFQPVRSADPLQHTMHKEYGELGAEAAQRLALAQKEGRRIISVGTTTLRILEQAALASGDSREIKPFQGWTDLFILPGYRFRLADALITNFHLPRSTLLMLVCAFAGRELVLPAYQEAISMGYGFYSFGDAMLVL